MSAPRPSRAGVTAAATVLGAVGVASLPVALVYPSALAPYLVALAGPVAAALAGEALGLPWLRTTGLIVTAVAAASPVVGLGVVLASLVVLGPLGVVAAVGAALRRVDATAGTAFLSACAIAIAGGFAAAAVSPLTALGVTFVVLVAGTATTLARLGDASDASDVSDVSDVG